MTDRNNQDRELLILAASIVDRMLATRHDDVTDEDFKNANDAGHAFLKDFTRQTGITTQQAHVAVIANAVLTGMGT